MLINQIPSIFIENFNQLEHFSKNSNIPQNPKIILPRKQFGLILKSVIMLVN